MKIKRIPRKYSSAKFKDELLISTYIDKLGNPFFLLEYEDNYCCFEKMSSVLDFIHSNFNPYEK